MSIQESENDYRDLFIGLDIQSPLLNGDQRRYINFDNAASTPSLFAVRDAVDSFLAYYSSVHRGTGFKSQLSTHLYEHARDIVLDFVGADPKTHTCVFGKNTTEAINKLANRYPFRPGKNLVLASGMEHHSNDLPWRGVAEVVHVGLTPDGRLDEDDFDARLAQYAGQIALVALTGASNVTGYINPVHRLAEKTHKVGAEIFIDAAQLAPHRKVDMRPLDDPGHLDYVALSGHKMYAPFGAGAMIGRREIFESGSPDMVGGGTVKIVTLDDVVWADSPDRDEAGSPNVVGAVAMAAGIRKLSQIGMEKVAQHEAELTSHLLSRLLEVPGIKIYGGSNPVEASDRLGVVPINLAGLSHFLVAAVLSYEFGIGVRNGCFCAHPYLLYLLGIDPFRAEQVRARMLAGDRTNMPGMVRISFGLYNTREEIDVLVEALKSIAAGEYQGDYIQDIASGEYHPRNWRHSFSEYFSL
jgi:selenocysteine lyase/cysteine desulfurase